ncbi:mitochondrial transcription rescue factor 1 [Trichomycterus rosablanca]|uniref:mitochondrial transcription rescue factor 1 n=1 Tax=Trichomycterus rosablanca TaxID=2290929 RepID=UPI002F35CB99
MQSLSVQALTLRQLGKLNSLYTLAPWNGPRLALRCPRALHARQLCGSTAPFFHRSSTLLKSRDAVRGLTYQQIQFKSSKRKKGRAGGAQEDQDEEGDAEEDPEASDYEDELQEDPSLPKDYKDYEKAVQSLRFDLVLKAGLDIARHKIEDAFYDHKLRLNGQKLIKKSRTVKVGDTLDIVIAEDKEKDTVTLKRVIFKKTLRETSDGDKYKVLLRSWKHLQLPRRDAFKE